jgi:hypothetical protein
MSDTPRTDAAILTEPFQVRTLSFEVVPVTFAEELERELAASQAKLTAVRQAASNAGCLEWLSAALAAYEAAKAGGAARKAAPPLDEPPSPA